MKSVTVEINYRPQHDQIKRDTYDAGVEIAISDENGVDCVYVPLHIHEHVIEQLQAKLRSHVTALYDIDDVLKNLAGLEPLPRPSSYTD
jgi:hypothetical protein